MRPIAFCALLFLIVFQDDARFPPKIGECTMGVFSGRATVDGRPILWKNRDIGEAVQKFCYYRPIVTPSDTTLAYIANANSSDTTRVYMGLNSAGFGIINSNTYNLGDDRTDGIDDGTIIRMALEHCRATADFEHLLDVTSVIGRRDSWNYGAIDAIGHAFLYECSNFSYARFDATDSIGDGNGLIIRATFSLSGGNNHEGLPRYKRATDLVRERLRTQGIDPQFIFQKLSRDLANPIANPYPLPYDGSQNGRPGGFINVHDISINRDITRSVAVIQGVVLGEDPRLATLYAMIGQPIASVAFPLWVESQTVPQAINGGIQVPMYAQVAQRLARLYTLPGDGDYIDSRYLIGKDSIGLLTYTLPLETAILNRTETYLEGWRQHIPSQEMFAFVENFLADSLFNAYLQIPMVFSSELAFNNKAEISNYPNPFNANTTINLAGFKLGEPVDITIYDVMGRLVRNYKASGGQESRIVWDGRDVSARALSSGVYFINAASAGHQATSKALLIK